MKLFNLCLLAVVSCAATDTTTGVNTTQACDMASSKDALLGTACKSLGNKATPIVNNIKSCTDKCNDDSCRQNCVITTLNDPSVAQNIGLPANITEEATECVKKCDQNTACKAACMPSASLTTSSQSSSRSNNDVQILATQSNIILALVATLIFSL